MHQPPPPPPPPLAQNQPLKTLQVFLLAGQSFSASTGGLTTEAGLRPIQDGHGIESLDGGHSGAGGHGDASKGHGVQSSHGAEHADSQSSDDGDEGTIL